MAPPHQQTFPPEQQPAPEQQAPAPEQQAPAPVLPHDLIIETLSRLPVKSVIRYKCASKNLNLLTVDPSFVKLHLGRSRTNRNMVSIRSNDRQVRVISCCERLQGPPFNLSPENEFKFNVDARFIPLTSCNGLLCFVETVDGARKTKQKIKMSGGYRFSIWNPALKKKFKESPLLVCKTTFLGPNVMGFGWDCVNNIYKIAVVLGPSQGMHVNVYNLGAKEWRNIGAFPAVPIHDTSVYVSGNLSCLAVLSIDSIGKNPDDLFIISLDLSSETFRRMSLPSLAVADITGYTRTHLGVLVDKLSFSHYCKMSTHFIIWTMEDFGIEDSWRMLARITIENLPMPIEEHTFAAKPPYTLRPWNLSPNREFLTLKMPGQNKVICYNCKEHVVVGSRQFRAIEWIDDNNYLESLVSPV